MPTITYSDEEYKDVRNMSCLLQTTLRDVIKGIGESQITDLFDNHNNNFTLIPLDIFEFIRQIDIVNEYICSKKNSFKQKRDTLKFLDAGCGIGHTLLLINENYNYRTNQKYYFDTFGLELNDNLIKLANGRIKKSIYHKDILTYDNYKLYDIIYYYSPIANQKKEQEFEMKVENDCKVGAIIIANRKQSSEILEDSRFKRINKNYHIFQKIKE